MTSGGGAGPSPPPAAPPPGGSGGARLPEGSAGIAARYPGDVGIATDPAVLFVEDFEQPTLDAVFARWESVSNRGNLSFSGDRPADSGGGRSLLVTHTGGRDDGSHLYRRLPPGEREVYLRFYVKFAADCWPIHHFVHVGGREPPLPYPTGGAGTRPSGNDRFSTAIETYGADWRWDFYSYWMEMRSWQSADGSGSSTYGNAFVREGAAQGWAAAGPAVARDRWTCVELMIKLNDPTSGRGGEQAFWIDGQLHRMGGQVVSHLGPGFPNGSWLRDKWSPDPSGSPFEGFRWRSSSLLDVNYLWLLVYITSAPAGHVSRVHVDDVVVATSYIGPLSR
ncbi:MAG: hypothetical protein M9894_25625 [Planctomycetes bacterium]|nr:hypothetical protein [Planctomycetota bacterium]